MKTSQELFEDYILIYKNKKLKLNPPAPYILFCELNRKSIVELYGDPFIIDFCKKNNINLSCSIGQISFSQMGKMLDFLWQNITQEEKQTYIDASVLIQHHIEQEIIFV